MADRIEKDTLGEVKVSANAYYGAQTQRALDNFKVSGFTLQKRFIYAYALLKKCAAVANNRTGKLDDEKAHAICSASDEILGGSLDSEFSVDAFQAGAGTSTNMNLNEVIANRATEILGGSRGQYLIHPNDHVNMSQSTNDTFHACLHIAALLAISEQLAPALEKLASSLEFKALEFENIVKTGRTHLMDAVPVTLGQEFHGYAGIIKSNLKYLNESSDYLKELCIGGTATGTKLNASQGYIDAFIEQLNSHTAMDFRAAANIFEAQQNTEAIVKSSNALKSIAVSLTKISNDLRLLNSGPVAGLAEITMPAVQPGSSIMPAKVNPSLAEMLNMACFQVIGNDLVITQASQAGQLELNVMMPVMAFNLIMSIEVLAGAINSFNERCLSGIKANEGRCTSLVDRNPILVTALTPYIGYEKAALVAKEVYVQNKTIREVVLEMKLMSEYEVDCLLDPKKLAKPDKPSEK